MNVSSRCRRHLAIYLCALTLAMASVASEACETYSGKQLGGLYELPPSEDMARLFAEILRHLGVEPSSFELRAANLDAFGLKLAAAVVCDGQRKVYYSPNDLAGLAGQRGDWARAAVLAHELGHHMNADTLRPEHDLYRYELAADDYAGYVLCQMGATVEQMRLGIDRFASVQGPEYPPADLRREATAAGWNRALVLDKCPPEARNALAGESLTGLTHRIDITQENAAELAQRDQLVARQIHIQDVDFVVQGPMLLFADHLSFGGSGQLRGRYLDIIAARIEGGSISGDGQETGESGGDLLVAALQIKGTSITARGAPGLNGSPGDPGKDGQNGSNGRDGRCGPGMLGEFRSSKAGSPGTNGGDGSPGEIGGNGGDGGHVILLTFSQRALFTDVAGGRAGQGGEGGQGGRAGQGGRGGSGCQGLGGSQPTRSPGADGRPGRNGQRGADGQPGTDGRLWNLPLESLDALKEELERSDDDLQRAAVNLRRRAVRTTTTTSANRSPGSLP